MIRTMKLRGVILGALVLCLSLTGCGQAAAADAVDVSAVEMPAEAYIDEMDMGLVSIEDEAIALADLPAVSLTVMPAASGTMEKRNAKAVIDYSHTDEGYVMVQYTGDTTKRLKVQVKGSNTQNLTYTYNINPKEWTVFPLSDGNGTYKITVYENVQDSKYSSVISLSCTVTLKDEFSPFLLPNQYVNYSNAVKTVEKAAELTKDLTDPLKKVSAVYDFVVKNLTYDKQKAATVQSGYLPVLDDVLEKKTGICFDYASLMTAMLRSQGVPCKLVVGYAGKAYHAWISVWSEAAGWIDGAIWFDGAIWHRMDPTFASTANQSSTVMKFIGDGSNYSAKYFY